MRGVESDQLVVAGVSPGLPVAVHQDRTPALPAVDGQVGHQEREIVAHVAATQVGVKLDAVHHPYRAVGQHVLGAQIAVALSHESPARPVGERLGVTGDERVRCCPQRPHPVAQYRLLDRPEQLLQVALDPALHLEHGRRHGDRLGVAVKLGQSSSDHDHGLLLDGPAASVAASVLRSS